MLVIFDCDGVLVDSEALSNRVLWQVLSEHGLDLTLEQTTATFIGRSFATVQARVDEMAGRSVDFGPEYVERRDAAFEDGLRPVDGIAEALDAIDHPTCVASSGDHAKMRRTLGLTGLYERFEGRIFSATEVKHGKPAPDLFLHAADRMGGAPADCVVIEDSPAGVEAGQRAGMRVLHYGTDFLHMRDLPGLL